MAEEIKKVITIEVGKSITSIRDFRKHIEDLRGSLLVLNQDSEEYKTIAAEIAQNQAKLNEVMKVGKTDTDAAAGSYVELNNQLKALRNQYKALSESDREGAVGKNMLVNIQQLDTKLKDLDEGMGVYNRNVGNYKQAFIDAFGIISQQVNKTNPGLSTLLSSAQKLVPAFLEVGKVAKATGSTMKAVLSSSGIGLIVVALGEIIANWESIYGWIQKVLGKQKDLTDEIKKSKDAANDLKTSFEEFFSTYNDIWIGLGYSTEQMAQSRVKVARQAVSDNARQIKQLEEYKRLIDEIDKTNLAEIGQGFNEIFTGDKEGWNREINAFWELVPKIEKELKHEVDSLGNEISRLGEKGGVYLNSQLHFGMVAAKKEIDKDIQDLKNKSKDLESIQTQAEVNYRQFQENALESARENVKQANDALKSEIELRQERYRQEYFDFANRIEQQKQYTIESIEDEEERNKVLISLEDEKKKGLLALEIEYNKDINEIRRKQWESSSTYAQQQRDLENINAIKKRLEEEGKTELDLLSENHMKELELFEKYGLDSTALREEYARKVQEIVDKQLQDELEANRQAQEKLLRQQKEYQEKRLENQQRSENWAIIAAETKDTRTDRKWYNLFGLFDGQQDIQKERDKEDSIYQIQQQGYMDRIDLHQQYLQTLESGTEEYMNTERAISEEKMNLAYLEYEYQEIMNDRILEDAEKKKAALSTIIQSSISAYKSITDAIIDSKEIEQGSEKWKAIKISQAVITTTHGVLSAFMSGFNSGLPAPWNIALGTATAAAAAAAGAAEIAKIKSTKMGSTSSTSSGISASSSMGASVSPLLNPDYDLQRITNLSLQSDDYLPGKTQVYVLESDIQEVGNRVQVRENNATF